MKRLISVILTLTMMLSLITVVPAQAAVNMSTFNSVLSAFKTQKYAHGSIYQDNPNLTGGYQCFGYANELALYIWGSYPTKSMSAASVNSGWIVTYGGSAVDNLCVGDIVRYRYHSIFITGISGDTIYYCHANSPSGTNKVTYDNTIAKSTLKSMVSEQLTSPNTTKTGWVAHCTKVSSLSVPEEPETHTHSYTYSNDSAHPHSEYRYCSCGSKEYTGAKKPITSCTNCYPVGNVKLTRTFEKTKGTATFYRNNASNAASYTLKLYKNEEPYGIYTMYSDVLNVTNLTSGEYYAVLYAKNTHTGEERSSSCGTFRIVDTYTVSFHANGGSGAPSSQTKIENTNLTLTSSVPTRAHYVFKGWARSKNATVAEYQPGDTYSRNAKVTLYAVWEPETYTIKFDANGGKGEIADTTITYGDAIRIPNDVICDYSYLKGWSTSKTATTATYKIGMDYKFDENTTLYAVWGTSTWTGGVSTSLSGSGTEADPYLIQSESDLGYLANKVNSQTTAPQYEYYKLTNNINLAYNEWVPIGLYGNEYQYFYGSFDGNGFTISDLYITKENEKNVGLFGYARDSEIKNLTVTGAIESITSSNALNIGAIVGYAENTTLKKLNTMYFNIGSISAGTTDYTRMGTIAGYVSGGSVSDCISTDSHIDLKSGKFEAGMIAGYSNAGIKDCSAIATTGGLFSTQTTVGEFRLGGLCGNLSANAERCSIYAPYFSNNIKTTAASSVGGLVGYLDGEVKVCSSQFSDDAANSITINGTGSTEIGGIAGFATSNAKITDCKFDGNSVTSTTTSGGTAVGGLVGSAEAKTNPTVSVSGGQSLSKADLPTKDGYKATWYTDAGMTTPYDFSQTVTSDITLYAKWEEGDDTPNIWDGTSKEPAYNADTKTYTITNGEEFAWVSDVTNGVITSGTNFPTDITFSGYTIELANDIYLNDTTNWENWGTAAPANSWKPIGKSETYPFSGTFDGKNYSVYGMYMYSTVCGIFGYTANVAIENLGIEKTYIKASGESGAVAANVNGKITNCFFGNAILTGSANVNDDYPYIGGIAGKLQDGEISYCYNKVDINGTRSICGGIVGYISPSSSVKHCYNIGILEGSSIGGIVGTSDGSIRECYNEGNLICTSDAAVGGIVAANNTGATLSYCYNSGNITGGAYTGGLAGKSNGTIHHGYNTGKVSSEYATLGSVVGCLAGYDNTAYLSYCYSPYTPLYETINENVSVVSVSYKSSSAMKTLSNLKDFPTSYWATNSNINDGYPYLKSLEETYKTYKITTIIDADNSAINRSFANINGNLTGSGNSNANVGGILGSASGSSGANSVAQNVIAIADGISSSHKVGNIVGYNSGLFTFNNAYYNTEMNVTSSSNTIDTTGTARSEISMNVPFYTNLLGLTPYTSLANVANDNKAVWVLENGKLPELYYNCLNDITISDDIENGSVTIDKAQAVDGEIVTVTATPNDGYVLNKLYVDGIEQDGTTFVVDGNDEVYVTFAEKIPVFDVSISSNENVTASLVNADASAPMLMSATTLSTSDESSITANDGEEIQVNAVADSDYTVDSIYVNGEEVAGTSFILTEDSVVTMDVTSISTDIAAVTNDAEDVGSYFAVVSGSVMGEDENAVKYIRYWSADDVDNVYVTEIESGSGDYTTVLMDLAAETTYYYQMTEYGEVKSFTTEEEIIPILDESEIEEEEGGSGTSQPSITTTTYKTLTSTYKFSIECSQALTTEFLAIACYDYKGKLLALKQIECDGDTSYTGSVPIDANMDYAKIFVWESIGSIIPIAEAEIVEIME